MAAHNATRMATEKTRIAEGVGDGMGECSPSLVRSEPACSVMQDSIIRDGKETTRDSRRRQRSRPANPAPSVLFPATFSRENGFCRNCEVTSILPCRKTVFSAYPETNNDFILGRSAA